MSNYIDRLIQETKDLDERIAKLETFINGPMFGDIDVREQELQVQQLKVERELTCILKSRLKVHGVKLHK